MGYEPGANGDWLSLLTAFTAESVWYSGGAIQRSCRTVFGLSDERHLPVFRNPVHAPGSVFADQGSLRYDIGISLFCC